MGLTLKHSGILTNLLDTLPFVHFNGCDSGYASIVQL